MTSRSPQTLFIGQETIRLREVDSTNTFALNLLRTKEVREGMVVVAEAQTGGRGQRGNVWMSEAGKNLTFSIVLKPVFLNISQQFDLTRAIGLGITDFLETYRDAMPVSPGGPFTPTISIKWPNDILVCRKKMAGILIENVLNGSQFSACVVGIGFNVNQTEFGEELSNATSLSGITKQEFLIEEIFSRLCVCLEARYLQLRAGQFEKLREDYDKQLFLKGVTSRWTDFKNEFEAVLDGVSAEGALVLKKSSGEECWFSFKEVGLII